MTIMRWTLVHSWGARWRTLVLHTCAACLRRAVGGYVTERRRLAAASSNSMQQTQPRPLQRRKNQCAMASKTGQTMECPLRWLERGCERGCDEEGTEGRWSAGEESTTRLWLAAVRRVG